MTRRAAILTFCDNAGPTNYGQILQCYAMQYLARSWGYDPMVVQYPGKDPEAFCAGEDLTRVQRFKDFIRKHIALSPPCYSRQAVEDATRDCELLICGSDQIWNPASFDPVFFLDLGAPGQRRIAYAPSGIFQDLPKWRGTYQKMAPLIERLDEVSVRERCGQKILSRYTDRDIGVKPDPTLSVPMEEWDRLAAPRLIREDYVLCYVLGELRPWQLVLRGIMRRHGIRKVVFIPSNVADPHGYAFTEPCVDAGPAEFLSLVKHAGAVCTDSLHGTIFSLLYERSLYNVWRKDDKNPYAGNERVENLAAETGKALRFISCVADMERDAPLSPGPC